MPECEVSTILNWADVVVLPYREASQSGIAPTALAAGRRVVATRVGGLSEQLEAEPLATLCEPDAASLAAALLSTLESSNDIVAPAVDAREAWRGFAAERAGWTGTADSETETRTALPTRRVRCRPCGRP